MASQQARMLAALAWTTDKTRHKVMDVDLAEAFADIIDRVENERAFNRLLLPQKPDAVKPGEEI